jgi:hypothetical protein
MPSLSIRRMHDTMIAREILAENIRATMTTDQPRHEWIDWIVTRPLKRRTGRKTVTVLYGYTKAEFARWWLRHRQPGWKVRAIQIKKGVYCGRTNKTS